MKTYLCQVRYQHTVLGSLYDSIVDILHRTVFGERFQQVVKGSSAKAIQYIREKETDETQISQGGLFPLLNVTFKLNGIDERVNHWWRYGRIGGGYLTSISTSFYKDTDLEMYIGWQRYQGSSDINIFATSLPEIQDMMITLHQYFPVPKYVYAGDNPILEAAITFPPTFEVEFMDGSTTLFDLSSYEQVLVRSINDNRASSLFRTKLLFRMEGISDGSSTMAGTEAGDYRLSGTLSWELELPAYCLIKTTKELTQKTILNFQDSSKLTSVTFSHDHSLFNDDPDFVIQDVGVYSINSENPEMQKSYSFSVSEIYTLSTFINSFNQATLSQPTSNVIEWAPLLTSKRIEQIVKAFQWTKEEVIAFLNTDDLTQTVDYYFNNTQFDSPGPADAAEIVSNLLTEFTIANVENTKSLVSVLNDVDLTFSDIYPLYTDKFNLLSDIEKTTRFLFTCYNEKLSLLKDYSMEYDYSIDDIVFKVLKKFKTYSIIPLRVFTYIKQ